MTMKRDDLIRLMRGVSRSLSLTLPGLPLARGASHETDADALADYALTFGGLALSCARLGDLPAVAVLLRASAAMTLRHAWLSEAERYLLDQQRPNGSFGLIFSELSSLKISRSDMGPWIRLTVEAVWALAERQIADDIYQECSQGRGKVASCGELARKV